MELARFVISFLKDQKSVPKSSLYLEMMSAVVHIQAFLYPEVCAKDTAETLQKRFVKE